MKIHRMTFDIAVENGAPDAYTLQSELCKAMREVGFVIGAEGVQNCLQVRSIDATKAIDRQIADGIPIDLWLLEHKNLPAAAR